MSWQGDMRKAGTTFWTLCVSSSQMVPVWINAGMARIRERQQKSELRQRCCKRSSRSERNSANAERNAGRCFTREPSDGWKWCRPSPGRNYTESEQYELTQCRHKNREDSRIRACQRSEDVLRN